MLTQGFISGFALIPPWALQECRAYGTCIIKGLVIIKFDVLALFESKGEPM